jgi:hypothetical protein
MRINSSGNVGIGTSAPTGTLSIASGTYNATTPLSTADDLVISGNGSLGMSFITLASGSSNQTIAFGDSDDTDIGQIKYAHANNSMSFTTNASEAMRIDSSGNLMVGVTSTTLSGNSLTLPNSGIVAFHDAGGNARNTLQFVSGELKHGAAGGGLTSQTFFTSAAERMRIDSLGNVGIGVVPEAWHSSYDVLQISSGASIAGSATNKSRLFLNANTYINTSNVQSYIATDEASQYWQNGGTHIFNVAASGSADCYDD